MKTNIIYILILILLPLFIEAQGSISGNVVSAEDTGLAVSDAEIFVDELNRFLEVDNEGNYIIDNIEFGTYTLSVFSYQYNTVTTEVVVTGDETLITEMTPFGEALSEVEIIARREQLYGLRQLQSVEGTSIYSGKKTEVVLIGQSASNLSSNIARQIYAQVVGLNIYDSNDAGLQLNIGGRGLDPNRTANFNTRQNGYDISPDVLGYPESYYTPPAEALKEIQVIRGAAALQYGTQFGGLVNFVMKTPNTQKPLEVILRNTIGSFGLINNFLSLSGTKNKLSYYGYFLFKQGDGFRQNSDFQSANAYLHLGYQISENTSLELDYTKLNYLAKQAGGLTDQQFDIDPNFSNRTRNWFEVDWNLYAAKLKHNVSKQTKLSLQVSYLDAARNTVGFRGNPGQLNQNPIIALDEQDVNGNFITPRDVIRGSFKNVAVEGKALHTWELKEIEIASLIGFKIYNSRNKSIQGPGTADVSDDFNLALSDYPDYPNQSDFSFPNNNVSFFTEHVWKLTDRLEVTPGIRWEHIRTRSDGDYNQVTFDLAGNPIFNEVFSDTLDLSRQFFLFGIGVSYQATSDIQLYGNLSQNYRSVTFSDIRVINPSFVIDPNISDESGYTLDLGVRGKWDNYLSFDAGVFTIIYNDRIGTILDNKANRVRKNIGRALIYGTEIFADWNVMSVWNSDSDRYRLNAFVNAAITGSQYVDVQQNNVEGKSVEFIPTVNIKTGIKTGFGNFLSSLQYVYLSEQYTDAENSQVAPIGDSRNGIVGPVPSYGIMDLSNSYRLGNFKFEAGINNLLNTRYFTRRATGYPGPGIIPSDPRSWYLGVELKF